MFILCHISFQKIKPRYIGTLNEGMAGSAAAVTAERLPPPPAHSRLHQQEDLRSVPVVGEESGKKAVVSKSEQLMEAVRRGELTAVRRLVDKGSADVCTVNTYGLSCLQLAIIGGHTKLAEFIIQRGANIHSIDSHGWTALHDAAQMDMKGLVRKLVSKGCNVTAATDLGELPIDVAGSVDMERTLCAEMLRAGEEKLATDYEEYLGLRHVTDENRVIFPMSHRGPLPMCFTNNRGAAYARFSPNKMQLQRRHSSPVITASIHNPTTTVGHQHRGPLAAKLKRSVAFCSEEEEAEEKPRENRPETANGSDQRRHTKLQEAVIDPPMHCSGHHLLYETGRHHQCRSSGSINVPRQQRPNSIAVAAAGVAGGGRANPSGIRGSANTSVRSLRESRAELGAFRSSATISAALGVCFDSVATTFDGEDSPRDENSPDEPTSSTADKSEAETGATDDFKIRTRKISFCEQSVYAAMARTKLGPSSVASAEKERAAGHLCEAERRELQEMKGAGVGDGADEPEADDHEVAVSREIAIANLKRLPRKPSIIFPNQRRRSSADGVPAADDGGASYRRRSVTFQPEVLLQEMVLDGDVLAVKKILDSGTLEDINKLSPAGLTALHQSAIDGNLECAKALITSGANVNCADCELWTPLHAAAMSGKIEVVRYLLSHGANSHLKNESQQTAYDVAKTGPIRKLLLCAMNGKSPDADEISDGEYSDEEEREYSHMESESDDDGEEPCYFDSPKTSHENSASPSPDFGEHSDNVFVNGTKRLPPSPATEGMTTILDSTPTTDNSRSSSSSNHNGASEESGANDFASEDQGISTMDGSSDCSHRSRMLSEDEGTTRDVLDSDLIPGTLDYRFQEASLSCNVDTLLKLVKHRTEIEIDRVNKSSGITALHHAVLEENFAMVQHLVKDFEADIHVKDRDGWTPLHAASAVGNIRIAQFLLESGAKASVLNNQCEFPVDVAEDEAMEKLLKNVMLGPSIGKLLK